MTQSANNATNETWIIRLGRLLAEITGTQPAILRAPFDENEAHADVFWSGGSGASAICIGISDADANRLPRAGEHTVPDETPGPARAAFADLLNRSLGRGELTEQSPVNPGRWELYKVEFAGGESIHLCVSQSEAVPDTSNLDMLMDIELPITLRFGRTRMALRDIAGLGSGSVIEFDRGVDEPVEVMVNGHVVALGEAVMVKGSYGVRISEISSRRERLLTSSFAAAQNDREPAGEQLG